ncbi:MAG: hypothetical protein BWY45_02076 [Euryarchaeota archaeon ADurb.Bin294]|jgi:beta-lactamase superfamily II metal-dependent hydrolase|nr:MAG: hypothetical protein BWY45_02076 [Euryarchaeota archaeon ADurb.Bin294]
MGEIKSVKLFRSKRCNHPGITGLDVMVSSHPHTDHIGGMVDVINGW